jgi:glycosyltransferase involved in cell wall biosynthesis
VTRLCYVIPTLERGGTETQLLHLIRGLASDHAITVLLAKGGGDLVDDARSAGARLRELNLRSGWDLRQGFTLRRLISEIEPDIVHTFLFGFDLATNRAARRCDVPVVISSRRELATWMKPRHLHLQCKANAFADCIVANSRAAADYACQREGGDPARYLVIYNGIHADDFVTRTDPGLAKETLGIPRDAPVLGMVANFSPVKDHRLFLDAAKLLTDNISDLHLLLVGKGALEATIGARIAELGLSRRVTRVNARGDIAECYAAMDVVALTSQVEGFPNALMEAMAAGKPVVAPIVGGVPELITDGETGRLVATRKPSDFADAIVRLLTDRQTPRRMGRSAAHHVRQTFTVERLVEAHRSLYADLLAQNGVG